MKNNKGQKLTQELLGGSKDNRQRVKDKIGEEFYEKQAHLVKTWKMGERPPKGLKLGEPPELNKSNTIKKYLEEEE